MKKSILILILFSFLFNIKTYSQNDTLMPGFVNIATLIVDFDTYQFESGNLSYFSCSSCSNDSLPFSIYYNSLGDFGDITFTLSSTFDTIFNATIIWMGTGHISIPDNYSSNYPFNSSSNFVEKPLDITYWNTSGQVTNDSSFISIADSAWHKIETLNITDMFSKLGFKVGIFLYPPTVGLFNPNVAKWIIFLYSNIELISINNIIESVNNPNIYPNPTNNTVQLNEYLFKEDAVYYTIISEMGSKLLDGKISNSNSQIDFSLLPAGLYYLQLFNNNKIQICTEKVIKR